MTHFLARLVDRTRGTASHVAPLIRSQFAPVADDDRTSAVESLRLLGAEHKPASKPPHEACTDTGGDRSPPPAAPGESDGALWEEIPLLVPHHSASRHNPGEPPDVTPRIAAGEPGAGRAAAGASQKSGRATVTAWTPQRKQHGDASSITSNGHESDRAPVVRITIGRIDVRAGPAPAASQRRPASEKPALTLDAYLKSRKEGAR